MCIRDRYGDEDEFGSRANLDRDYLEAKSYYDSEMNKLNLLDLSLIHI